MARKYTNDQDISLLMAVFLADDRYEHDDRPNVISATALMKSTRQIVLSSRLTPGESLVDISGLLSSRLGTAIHESIEKAWVQNYVKSLDALGYPQRVINSININPTEKKEGINLWLELRTERPLGNWIISGCADVIMEGAVRDIKSTKVWSFLSGSNEQKYQLQLSIYRWLNPDKILEDTGYIEYLFTDWSQLKSTYEKGYPRLPVLAQPIPLLSTASTEGYLLTKLEDIEHYAQVAEVELPLCTDEDLWVRSSEWKYYANADAQRATKNFQDNKAAAYSYLHEKGKGEVREIKGKAMACNYCNARSICSQYTSLVVAGRI
jgi:hypothetical protein